MIIITIITGLECKRDSMGGINEKVEETEWV
jgi:hypothetical protein